MEIKETKIKDLFIVKPQIYKDTRGYFFESYNQKNMQQKGLNFQFVQDNQSKSVYGVIRGLHYQIAPYAQTKLVRVLQGKIYDVAVDLRKNSPTFGEHFGIELSDHNKQQLLIPKGFAHGFSVLSEEAVVMYKCDEFYNPTAERGIIFSDEKFNIDWQIKESKMIVSEKDLRNPSFEEASSNDEL